MCSDKKIGAVVIIRDERSTRRHVQQVPPPRAKTKHSGFIGSSSAAVLVQFRGFYCPHHSVKMSCAKQSLSKTERRPYGQQKLSTGLFGSTTVSILRSLLQEILNFEDLQVQFDVRCIALKFFPLSTRHREAPVVSLTK